MPELTAAQRLHALAEAELPLIQLPAEEWPDVVQRAYHVGRRLAFTQAAVIAEIHQPGEGENHGPDDH